MPLLAVICALSILVAPTPPAARSAGFESVGAAALHPVVVTSAATTGWRAPVDGPLLVRRGFDPPTARWAPGHRGVDLAAPVGTVIRAAGPGIVVFAGRLAGRGVISIEHAPGVRTTYEPVRALVTAGQRVHAGTLIARVSPDRRHRDVVHWGLRIRDGYADPLRLLRGAPTLRPTRHTRASGMRIRHAHHTPASRTRMGLFDHRTQPLD